MFQSTQKGHFPANLLASKTKPTQQNKIKI